MRASYDIRTLVNLEYNSNKALLNRLTNIYSIYIDLITRC